MALVDYETKYPGTDMLQYAFKLIGEYRQAIVDLEAAAAALAVRVTALEGLEAKRKAADLKSS
jgi:hypothetical protein